MLFTVSYSKTVVTLFLLLFAWKNSNDAVKSNPFTTHFIDQIDEFNLHLKQLEDAVASDDQPAIDALLTKSRLSLKTVDFILRYANPLAHKGVNGPLPVEWEVEVFEKWEAPYKRIGNGLTQLEIALDEGRSTKQLLHEIRIAQDSLATYKSQDIIALISRPSFLPFANRLFLLNCAALYTTGFDCPDSNKVIPEFKHTLNEALVYYQKYNLSFPNTPIEQDYITKFQKLQQWIELDNTGFSAFDRYKLIKEFIAPLYDLNQSLVRKHNWRSHSWVDYSLNAKEDWIFSKHLYQAQDAENFIRFLDTKKQQLALQLGEQMFKDKHFSIDNSRSCSSCHDPNVKLNTKGEIAATSLKGVGSLPRNTPTLTNVLFNHLIHIDGDHLSLMSQIKGVLQAEDEMNMDLDTLFERIHHNRAYCKILNKISPRKRNWQLEDALQCMIYYYSQDSYHLSPFDRSMKGGGEISADAINGFNLFMGKAQCGTCHFPPQFNGVKPPYTNSEFEVIGVPEDSIYSELSDDLGRGVVHDVPEMQNAFRTPTVRNLDHTAPYMHNGVFNTLDQVMEFYNHGGGIGNGLDVPNQSLAADSLHLDQTEIDQILAFLETLNEEEN